ncbi:hypothetical protein L7F22_036868 [Adiantum nelumboides]|nr:hypothetical protein [Adiantum nelumboides]
MLLLQHLWTCQDALPPLTCHSTNTKLTSGSCRFYDSRSRAKKPLSGWLMEGPHPHIQATTSSSRQVCSTIVHLHDTNHEALLDSGSTISSISSHLVTQLGLQTSTTSPICVLFGDNKELYTSDTLAHCTFYISNNLFHHTFYVFPRQLFPITLGCDWFIKHRARLQFDIHHLVLPQTLPIPLLYSNSRPNFVNTQCTIIDAEACTIDIRSLLHKFPTLFQKPLRTSTVSLPICHSIKTTQDRPIKMATRRRSPKENAIINEAVQEMLAKDIITLSYSSWASKPHLVRKDDGSYRFCIDFRPLNKITVDDLYPLPRVDDLLDQLGKSRYFASLDLAFGYWQIPLNPSDAHKIAFRTPTGIYQFNRMPFGLSDAGSSFQRMVNHIFQDLIQRGVVVVYLDDILVHTTTWAQLLQVLKEVLTRIRQFNL